MFDLRFNVSAVSNEVPLIPPVPQSVIDGTTAWNTAVDSGAVQPPPPRSGGAPRRVGGAHGHQTAAGGGASGAPATSTTSAAAEWLERARRGILRREDFGNRLVLPSDARFGPSVHLTPFSNLVVDEPAPAASSAAPAAGAESWATRVARAAAVAPRAAAPPAGSSAASAANVPDDDRPPPSVGSSTPPPDSAAASSSLPPTPAVPVSWAAMAVTPPTSPIKAGIPAMPPPAAAAPALPGTVAAGAPALNYAAVLARQRSSTAAAGADAPTGSSAPPAKGSCKPEAAGSPRASTASSNKVGDGSGPAAKQQPQASKSSAPTAAAPAGGKPADRGSSAGGKADEFEVPPQWRSEQQRLALLADFTDDQLGFAPPWEAGSSVVAAALVDDAPSLPGLENCPRSAVGAMRRPPLKFVGGLDISFVKDTNIAVASIVVLELPQLKVLHTKMLHCEMKAPYIPGYLAFREVEPLQRVVAEATKEWPEHAPQVYFVDGNGLLHYRKCGLATHLGVLLGVPTVGCAKNLLHVDGLDRDRVAAEVVRAAKAAPPRSRPEEHAVELVGASGFSWGFAALTGNSAARPIYVSPGHRVSTVTAMRLALAMAPYRVIEPIRQADLQSRQYIKEHFGTSDAPAAKA